MAREVFLKNSAGTVKSSYVGFSWTVFFFGCFAPLFRGNFSWFLIMAFVGIVRIIAERLPPDYYASSNGQMWFSIIFIVIHLFFSFTYNKFYTQGLIGKGFYPADNVSELLLKKYRIL